MTHGGHKAGDQNSQDEALKPGLLLSGWGGDGPWGGARPGSGGWLLAWIGRAVSASILERKGIPEMAVSASPLGTQAFQ